MGCVMHFLCVSQLLFPFFFEFLIIGFVDSMFLDDYSGTINCYIFFL